MEKIAFFLPTIVPPLVCYRPPILQYYERYEPMILDMWVKSKFVFWQPRYYNLLV